MCFILPVVAHCCVCCSACVFNDSGIAMVELGFADAVVAASFCCCVVRLLSLREFCWTDFS